MKKRTEMPIPGMSREVHLESRGDLKVKRMRESHIGDSKHGPHARETSDFIAPSTTIYFVSFYQGGRGQILLKSVGS